MRPAPGAQANTGKRRKEQITMRKRIAALALAAVMTFGLAGCGGGSSSSTAAPADSGTASGGVSGEFSGTATGMGEVTVTVTLTDGVITGCEVVGDDETDGIGSVVVEAAPDEIVSGNKGAIDVVSGATITSNAINEALAAALTAAGLDAADFTGSGD
ncbi:MAG TPA: FMN-binding protein, partial [Candidatus Faecalibacterium faecipullorum]|nr:FMN-binding protein [Candidatus Faecalibacterium faecipullorum]